MSKHVSSTYQISNAQEGVRRVIWQGPLESSDPAIDAERIAAEAAGNRGEGVGEDRVVLDLSQCQSITTGGIALLIYLRRRFLDSPTEWSIVGAPVALLRSLNLLNLDDAFELRSLPAMAALLSDEETMLASAPNEAVTPSSDDQ